jgi:hypothetical protein
MDLEIKASALPNAFYQSINRVRGEGSATLGRKHEGAIRELPA